MVPDAYKELTVRPLSPFFIFFGDLNREHSGLQELLLILYENKYLDMEIPGTIMCFYRKKEERKKEKNPKDLFQVAAVQNIP